MKKALLILIVGLLFLPMMQQQFLFISEEELNGEFTLIEAPDSLKTNWFNSKHQNQYNAYCNEQIGFRNTFVRIYNQYNFSLFKKANSANTLVGKDDVLFQENIIKSYLGENFAGEKNLDSLVLNFKKVQLDLEEKGILLLAVFAPNKASYYSGGFPKKYSKARKNINNYEYLSQKFEDANLNHIDMSDMLRNTDSEYPLFPKNGMHWAGYSTALTFSTLSSFIEIKQNKKLRDYALLPGELLEDNLRYTDNDIADAMNMLWPLENYQMYYPKIKFEEGDFYAPNTLIIGDSYSQSYYGFYPFYENVFSPDSKVWYYNRVVQWPYQGDKEVNVSKLNQKKEILSRDVIILIATEDNIQNLGFGFLEEYDFILNNTKSLREREILNITYKIKSNEKWFSFIKKQAIERKQTIEETLRANAVFVYNSKKVSIRE